MSKIIRSQRPQGELAPHCTTTSQPLQWLLGARPHTLEHEGVHEAAKHTQWKGMGPLALTLPSISVARCVICFQGKLDFIPGMAGAKMSSHNPLLLPHYQSQLLQSSWEMLIFLLNTSHLFWYLEVVIKNPKNSSSGRMKRWLCS